MGLQDRDYLRPSSASPLATFHGTVFQRAWFRLLLVNLVVFLLWRVPGLAPLLQEHFTVSGTGVLEDLRVWTLFTSAFSHADGWHLFWNMLFLFLFARELEVIYGAKDMLLLYLFGALFASLGHIAVSFAWGHPATPMLGASGSVMAIVVAATLFFPHRKLYVWGLLPVPFWALASLYLLMDLIGLAGTARGEVSGVAHAGHLGGAVAGAAFKLLDLRLFSRGSEAARGSAGPGLFERLRRPKSGKIIRLEDHLARRPRRDEPRRVDPDLASQVDEILRKINREGLDSLTPDERRVLDEASERFKR